MDLDPERPAEELPIHDLVRRPFREMFTRDEIVLYGYGALTYIVLGVFVTDLILNWIIGPLYLVLWVWWVPPLVDRWRANRKTPASGVPPEEMP
jgi:hypothetical protein